MGNRRYNTGTAHEFLINGASVLTIDSTGIVEPASDIGTAAAAGSDQSGATALTKAVTYVTASDGTKGVKLPTASAGLRRYVYNTVAGNNLLVYPNTSDDINDGTTNVHVLIPGKTAGFFYAIDSTTWMFMPGAYGSTISADTIAELTAASGVTVDGVLLKDGEVDIADSKSVLFGTGDDFGLQWNATRMAVETIGDQAIWNGAPTKADPSVVAHEFFDDFTLLDSNWTVTEDDSENAQAVGDENFGVLTMTCKAATDDNAHQVQYAQETFQLIQGKKLWFEARVKCPAGDATNLDFFVGLAEAEDLTGVADNMPANGFGFHKDDGDANIDASSSDNGTNLQQATVDTLVDDTWVRLGMVFDGAASGSATLTPYVDGVAGTPIASVTYATMAEVSPIIMLRNGDGTTTQVLKCDYFKVIQER